jgi:hypothetical protein
MRSFLLALLLVLAFAGGAQAQQRVQTGALPRATAGPSRPRPVPARMIRQVKARALVSRGTASPAARASVQRAGTGRSSVRPPKRPAPRG